MSRGFRTAVFIGIAALLALGASVACSDSGNEEDEQAIEDSLRGLVERYNAKDVDGFYASFTDKGLTEFIESLGGEPVEDLATAKTESAAGIGEDPIAFRSVDASVDGDEATAEFLVDSGGTIEGDDLALIKDADTWKIDSFAGYAVSPDVPDGYETIDLTMNEFSFDLGSDGVSAGKVAFALENEGDQPHEALLFKVAPGVKLEEALQAEGEPEGIEFQAFSSAEPGDSYNMVLLDDLAAGHYAFVCFFPDTDDPEMTPHAFKGMVSEFDVQ